MGHTFVVMYNDKDDNFTKKELHFDDRRLAVDEAKKLRDAGHSNVEVSSEGNNTGHSDMEVPAHVVGSIIRVIGILVIVAGLIFGFIQSKDSSSSYNEYDIAVLLYWWAGAIITGMLLVGFAEVIKLLDQINKKMTLK